MGVLTESMHRGEFLESEANGKRGRRAATIASSVALKTGTVLGMVTASGKYKLHDPAAVDGTETASAILYGDADASGGDAPAVVVVSDAVVIGAALTYKSGMSQANKDAAQAALEAQGIVFR